MAFGEGYTGCGKSSCREKESSLWLTRNRDTEKFLPKIPSFAFFLQPLDYCKTSLGLVSLVGLRILPNGGSQCLAGAGDALWDAGLLQASF